MADIKKTVEIIFGGVSNKPLSTRYGLTVTLCPYCHRELHEGAHSALYKAKLHEYGQRKAMEENGWTIDDFRRVFGKNYLEDEQC